MLCIKKDREKIMQKNVGKIEIGGHSYEVIELELVHEQDNKELYGRHEVKTNTILLNNTIHPDRKKETFIHEVLHAILLNGGHEHPEHIIDCISNGLFQLGVGEHLWKSLKK